MTKCGQGWYFDRVVQRCAGCHEICHGWTIKDKTSDCYTFCPGYQGSGGEAQTPSSQIDVTEVVLYVLAVTAVVSIVIGLLFWRLRRRQRHTPLPGDPEAPPIQETEPCQENTPIPEEEPEVGFSDLHIPMIDHPTDETLTTTQC